MESNDQGVLQIAYQAAWRSDFTNISMAKISSDQGPLLSAIKRSIVVEIHT